MFTNSLFYFSTQEQHIRFWQSAHIYTRWKLRPNCERRDWRRGEMYGIVLTNILLINLPKPWSFHFDVDDMHTSIGQESCTEKDAQQFSHSSFCSRWGRERGSLHLTSVRYGELRKFGAENAPSRIALIENWTNEWKLNEAKECETKLCRVPVSG